MLIEDDQANRQETELGSGTGATTYPECAAALMRAVLTLW